MTDQPNYLRRLLALSTQHIYGECANPCDVSLASIDSDSLLSDAAPEDQPNRETDDGRIETQKIKPWAETFLSPIHESAVAKRQSD